MEHIVNLRPQLENKICDWNEYDINSSKKHETQRNLNKLLDLLEEKKSSPEYVIEIFACAQRLQDDPAVKSILEVLEENAHRFLSESDLRFILPGFQKNAAVFAHLQASEAPTKYILIFRQLIKTPYLWSFGFRQKLDKIFGESGTHNEVHFSLIGLLLSVFSVFSKN